MRGGVYAGPFPQADPGVRKQVLESQAQTLQSELDLIKKQIAELDTGAETQ
jgi:serine protease inhibitor ecotin